MNLEQARIVLRPRTPAELAELALFWQREVGGRLYLRLAAIALLPSLVLCAWLRYGLNMEWPLIWFAALCTTSVTQGVFTVACGQLMFAETTRTRDVMKAFTRRLPSYSLATFVRGTLLAASLAACAAPFLFVWPRLAFTYEASLLESLSPNKAISRANRFVVRRTSEIFGIGLTMLAALASLTLIGELLGGNLMSFVLQLGRPFGSLLDDGGSIWALIGFHAAIPFIASLRFLAYIDQRTRADGWDIQVKFMALLRAEEESLERAA